MKGYRIKTGLVGTECFICSSPLEWTGKGETNCTGCGANPMQREAAMERGRSGPFVRPMTPQEAEGVDKHSYLNLL